MKTRRQLRQRLGSRVGRRSGTKSGIGRKRVRTSLAELVEKQMRAQ